ncbi:SPOR domain-containing protein [Moraxella bovis]|uniref:SPOR and LysM peptidoglycan-binding domain-containing protein n=1 Tax=Moraxella bovis TaxID=476 RepID=UPI00222608BE|nr:SPOR domain-containing protein [Moraxella bovis]UZA42581.1 SPOR domain-containing protein [Moraxella bovis]
MISKQLLLGLSLVLGGGVILYAVNQGQSDTAQNVQTAKTIPQTDNVATTADDGVVRPTVEPLTVDMATESKLLSAKQEAREARTLAQEKEAMALIEAQEKAQQLALDKATAEQKATATPADTLTVETRPEAIAVAKAQAKRELLEKLAKEKELKAKKEQEQREKDDKEKAKKEQDEKAKADKLKAQKSQDKKDKAEKEKKEQAKKARDEAPQNANNGQHKVVRGDGLIKLSRQYGVPVSALAEANNMGRHDPLPLGKTIKIPSKAQVARLEREAKEREAQKAAAASADKRLKEARQKGSDGDSNARYGVQVSLADNQAKADELAKRYRNAGYKVSTSQTSRGVRVLVGSEKNQDAAAALRDKIKNDSRVDGSGAWVKRVQ